MAEAPVKPEGQELHQTSTFNIWAVEDKTTITHKEGKT